MATRAEYKAQGYTDEQINKAIANSGMGGAPMNVAPANAPITVTDSKTITPIRPEDYNISKMVEKTNPYATVNNPDKTAAEAAADLDWNARQKAFDALNPVGTKEADVKHSVTEEQVAAAKESMTFRPTVAPTPAPTATETPKPTATPAKTGVNYDTSVGREAEIQSNLKRISGENPALLTDRAKFDQAFGYSTADAGKKALLDSFFEGSQPKSQSPDDVFALLRSGRTAFDQATMKSGAYQTALKRFQDFNRYSGYNASQLATAISSGDLIQGSQAYNDLYADPKIRANLDYARSFIITKGVDLAKTGEKKTEEIISNNPNTASAFADGVITAEEYKAMISSPEIEGKRKDVEAKKNEYDKLKAQYDAIDDEVDEELKGTGATSSYAAALKAQRRKGIYKDLQIASDTYNNAVGTLADLTKTQAGLVEMNLGLYKEQQAFAKQKELAKYNQELALETSQKKFEQELAQKTQMASDPVLATQDVIDQYRKLGVMAERSDAEIIASVKNDIASGMTLGQSLTNLNKAFQSKDAYKAKMAGETQYKEFGGDLYSVQNGKLTKVVSGTTTGTQDWSKLDDKTLYNQRTGETKSVSSLTSGASATDLLTVPDGTVIPSRLSETTNPNKGKECAEYVNDITKVGMGDTFSSKVAKTDTQDPSMAGVGNVAVWNPNWNDPKWTKYGHAGIIVGEDGDNWLIKSSNLKGDGAISTDKVPKSSITAYNTKVNAQPKPPELAPLSDKQYTQFNQAKSSFKTDPEVKAFESALTQAEELATSLNSASGPGDIGAVFQFMKSLDPASVVREGEFALAAKSAGIWEQFKNVPANKWEGVILTDKQRKQFGQLAKEYVKAKGTAYRREYGDMERVLTGMKVPKEYWPTNAYDEMEKIFSSNAQNQAVPEDFLSLYNSL